MNFDGEFTVDGTPEELWKYFTDPDILQDAAPGCESMTLTSPSQITATLAVGVGSVKPSFDVDAVVTEADRPNRLEITASGEASRNAFELSAWQELRDNGDGTTTVSWEANAEISGIIASMGERAIGSVADKLVNEFFEDLEAHVNSGTPAESKLMAADEDDAVVESEEAVAEPETAAGGLVDTAVGIAAGTLGGDSTVPALGLGAGIGVAVATIWHRLTGNGPPGETGTTDRIATGGGGHSLLTVLLALALGAVSALLWSQSQDGGIDAGSTESVSTATADAGDEPTDTTATSATDTESHENGTESRADPAAGNLLDENPIDRLESRP